MNPLATVFELADYIGDPIIDEVDVKQAEALLKAASALVRGAARQPEWEDIAVPDTAKYVTLACAARGFLNFEGWTGEAVDDWRGSGRKVDEAGLFLTATERATLVGLRPVKPVLGTVSTYRDYDTASTAGLVPVEGTETQFPWY